MAETLQPAGHQTETVRKPSRNPHETCSRMIQVEFLEETPGAPVGSIFHGLAAEDTSG